MNRFLAALALVLLTLPVGSSQAQPAGPASPDRDDGWFAVGYGPGTPHELSGGVTANIGSSHVFQAGLHSTGDLFSRSEITAFSVAYGRSHVGRWGRSALFAGPSITRVVHIQERGFDSEWEEALTPGVVVSAQVTLTPTILGLGLEAFALVNGIRSGAGLCLTLVLEGDR